MEESLAADTVEPDVCNVEADAEWKRGCAIETEPLDFYIGPKAGSHLSAKIRDAKKSIKIISPYITADEIEKLCQKKCSGFNDISIITSAADIDLKNAGKIEALHKIIYYEKSETGEAVYTAAFKSIFFRANSFHAKLYIIDEKTAFAGSLNFTTNGMNTNYETCITIKDEKTVKKLVDYYEGLFSVNMNKWKVEELGQKIFFNLKELKSKN